MIYCNFLFILGHQKIQLNINVKLLVTRLDQCIICLCLEMIIMVVMIMVIMMMMMTTIMMTSIISIIFMMTIAPYFKNIS